MNKFSDILKTKRQAAGISYNDLSNKTGIAASVLFKYEVGEIYPRQKALNKICEFLSLKPKEIAAIISKEKKGKSQKKYISRIYGNSSYPDLRKIILESYSPDYVVDRKNIISLRKMIKEFDPHEIHPFERIILNEVNKRLWSKKLIPSKKDVLSNDFSSEERTKFFKQVVTDWGYNPITKQLILSYYEEKKGHVTTICCKVNNA